MPSTEHLLTYYTEHAFKSDIALLGHLSAIFSFFLS